ncbi:hypothetical protein LTR28_011860, partial [Elasticomyces elasticus]
MAKDLEHSADERTRLLQGSAVDRRLSAVQQRDDAASSIVKSHVTVEEQAMAGSTVGERLAYNDYTTIDWLHDLVDKPILHVKDSYRLRFIHGRKGIRYELYSLFDSASGWIAAALIGTLTACVAFLVDVAEATVSDWKLGYCTRNPFLNREACCEDKTPLLGIASEVGDRCAHFKVWSDGFAPSFAIYVAFALAFGVISSTATMFTK